MGGLGSGRKRFKQAREDAIAAKHDRELAEQAISRWEDPVVFASEVFNVELWDKQAEVARAIAFSNHGRVACRSGHKIGKGQPLDGVVVTPKGFKAIGDISPGDYVISDSGEPCKVVAETVWHERPHMRVTFEDGTHVDVDEAHEWVVHTRKSRKCTSSHPVTLETRQMFESQTVPNGKNSNKTPRRISNYTVDLTKPVQLPHVDLPIDPYLLGVWLGDGTSATGEITTMDAEIVEAFEAAGYRMVSSRKKSRATKYLIHNNNGYPVFRWVLKSAGLLNNKHIPDIYMWSSAEQRLAIIQGLMDADGYCSTSGHCQFCSTNKKLAEGVLQLARSLGIKARIHEKRAKLYGKDCGPKWHVEWRSTVPVFRLRRKVERIRTEWKHKVNAHKRIAIVSINKLPGKHTTKCIEVDSPSHLYLCTESFIPTHNSMLDMIVGVQFILLHEEARVVLTAPTARQVRSILWRELQLLHAKAKWPLGGKLSMQPDIGWQFADGREMVGFATDEPERMAGISGKNVLFIVDEASGVPEPIFEAIEGNRAGGAKILMTSNPTKTSGTFYNAFNEQRALWDTFHISSRETPNALTGQKIIPGLAEQWWCDEKAEEWGEDSPLYAVRIEGNFPAEGFNTVIPIHLLEKALDGWEDVEVNRDDQLCIGVDVARFGDDSTVLFPRRGNKAMMPTVLQKQRTGQVVANVVEMANSLKMSPREVVKVMVDVTGLGGGVADGLRRIQGIDCVEVNSSERAHNEDNYCNVKTELWFSLRDWIRDGGKIPPGVSKLESELVMPLYDYDTHNRYRVEGKKDIKKRLKRSPDRADALALAVYEARSVETDFFSIKSAR
jgi:hypothetical protein